MASVAAGAAPGLAAGPLDPSAVKAGRPDSKGALFAARLRESLGKPEDLDRTLCVRALIYPQVAPSYEGRGRAEPACGSTTIVSIQALTGLRCFGAAPLLCHTQPQARARRRTADDAFNGLCCGGRIPRPLIPRANALRGDCS